VGRYRSVLTGAELALIQLVAGQELRGHGYPIDQVRFADRAGVVPRLVRSPAELVGRFVRRWQLGGRSYARTVAVGYGRRLRHVVRRFKPRAGASDTSTAPDIDSVPCR
jgi:hypothetical protein